jgi:hypothetical protein
VCWNDLFDRSKPKAEQKNPKLLEDIRKIIEPPTHSDPKMRTTLLYTNTAAQSVYDALFREGWTPAALPTIRTISDILNKHDYRLRTVAKTVQKKLRNRTASSRTSEKRINGQMRQYESV